MTKKYRVTLTALEREELGAVLSRGKADVRKLKHAQVLLRADEAGAGEASGGVAADGGPGWCDTRIAEAVGVGVATVQRVRQRFVEGGFAAALSIYRTGGRAYERKLDGAQEAHLIALACGTPPQGRARWTLRLLAGRMIELQHTDAVSHETVRQVLKKTLSSRT
jgi:transposase